MRTSTSLGSRTSRSSAMYAASASVSARSSESSIPLAFMNSTSGGSRLRAPTSAASSGRTTPGVENHAEGHPPRFPDGDVSGVFRSPCASIQINGEPVDPSSEPLCRTDVCAAAASEHDRSQQPGPRRSRRSARRASLARRPRLRDTGAERARPSAIPSPPAPHAAGTRTSPAANVLPQLWHS